MVLWLSPGKGAEPSGPNSTNDGTLSRIFSRVTTPGFFLRLRGAQSAGRRLTWNIMEPANKKIYKNIKTIYKYKTRKIIVLNVYNTTLTVQIKIKKIDNNLKNIIRTKIFLYYF